MYRKRFSRKLRLIPVDSTKNIVQIEDAIASGVVGIYPIAVAVPPASIDESNAALVMNVEENASVKMFNLNFRLTNNNADAGKIKCQLAVMKLELGIAGPNLAQMNAIGAYNRKNRVFFFAQNQPPSEQGIPMTIPSLIVPRRFHRMAFGDQWVVIVANNSAGSVNFCGTAIYKWYR